MHSLGFVQWRQMSRQLQKWNAKTLEWMTLLKNPLNSRASHECWTDICTFVTTRPKLPAPMLHAFVPSFSQLWNALTHLPYALASSVREAFNTIENRIRIQLQKIRTGNFERERESLCWRHRCILPLLPRWHRLPNLLCANSCQSQSSDCILPLRAPN